MVDIAFEADGMMPADGEAVPAKYSQDDPMARAQFLMQVSDPGVINFADQLGDEERRKIAATALEEYRIDKESMADWTETMRKGVDLAMLVKDTKNYPFKRAANVKFPLVTSAALQFNARAYPAIVPNGDVVQCRTYGADPTGEKATRAKRVAEHMSYQLSAEVEEWEEETDKLLVTLPLVGTMFRKVWFDPVLGRIRVRLCDPGKVIVNDGIRSIQDCPRISEEIQLYPHEIRERIKSGQFIEFDFDGQGEAGADADGEVRETSEDPDATRMFIEQHRRIDLDEDGYPEPYIVTVHRETEQLVRIVADFDAEDVQVTGQGEVVGIARGSHYAAYHFLPNPGGGFFGLGFGLLLGDISDSVNTTINQLFNTAHMSSMGAGFIGSEFRIKGGMSRFEPGEWKAVSNPGQDIRTAMVPLQFPEPSPVMFQLLGLLIEAGREIASVKDVMTGEASRQMTATTTLALIEQGQMLFSAAYKRVWRALKVEFKLIAKINAETLDPARYAAFHDTGSPQMGHNGGPPMDQIPPEMLAQMGGQMPPQGPDPRADYNLADMDICPVADPRSVTSPQKLAKAQMLMEMASAGMVDPAAAAARMMEAAGIEAPEELAPQPDPVAQEAAAIAQELEIKRATFETAKIEAEAISEMAKAIKYIADAEAAEVGPQLEQYKAQLGLIQERMRAADRQGARGVEGASGNGGAAGQADAGARMAEALALGSGMGGGPVGPGSGAVDPAAAGLGGRPVR